MTSAGNRAASFGEASDALFELAEVSISAERIRRACGHVGHDLIDEQRQLQEAYQAKPVPEQATGKPADMTAPEIACVMADGGRYQRLDRPRGEATCDEKRCGANKCRSARKGKHWKESRIALLARMSGSQHDVDPQPELPPSLRYAAAAEKLGEIGKTGRALEESEASHEQMTIQTTRCARGREAVRPLLSTARRGYPEFLRFRKPAHRNDDVSKESHLGATIS